MEIIDQIQVNEEIKLEIQRIANNAEEKFGSKDYNIYLKKDNDKTLNGACCSSKLG